MKNTFFTSVALLILTISCSTKATGNKSLHAIPDEELTQIHDNQTEETTHEDQTIFLAKNVAVGFTAYKFTNKTGVKGAFEKLDINGGTPEAASIKESLNNVHFSIPVSSIETNDEDRNGKIVKHFFETILTDNIEGVFSVNEDKVSATIQMNNISSTVDFVVNTVDAHHLELKAELDLANWDAIKGINALNEICKVLHTGEDGESKLWSVVDLDIVIDNSDHH